MAMPGAESSQLLESKLASAGGGGGVGGAILTAWPGGNCG